MANKVLKNIIVKINDKLIKYLERINYYVPSENKEVGTISKKGYVIACQAFLLISYLLYYCTNYISIMQEKSLVCSGFYLWAITVLIVVLENACKISIGSVKWKSTKENFYKETNSKNTRFLELSFVFQKRGYIYRIVLYGFFSACILVCGILWETLCNQSRIILYIYYVFVALSSLTIVIDAIIKAIVEYYGALDMYWCRITTSK